MMASGLWVGDVPPELAEVSVGELASLDDESFWKLAASQYDDHEFDSFDVDNGFWHEASQQTANIMDDGEEKSASKGSSRFAKPETMENLQLTPAKTRNQTNWAVRTWMSWRLARIQAAQPNDEMPPRLTQMLKSKLCKWLFFVVEVRRQDSKRYPGTTLHGILCGIQRHVRKQKPSQASETIDFFSNPEFKFLRDVLDAQMKDLRSHGVGSSKKQAEHCWYDCKPVGHNPLGNTVCRLCRKAEIPGYKTNHSLRVSAATRLFQKDVDEQLTPKFSSSATYHSIASSPSTASSPEYSRMFLSSYQLSVNLKLPVGGLELTC